MDRTFLYCIWMEEFREDLEFIPTNPCYLFGLNIKWFVDEFEIFNYLSFFITF